jgi:hypothetical protein
MPDPDTRPTAQPARLVIGVGASRGVATGEVLTLIEDTLRDAGLAPLDVTALATVNTRGAEPGLVAAAASMGVALRTYTAAELAGVRVPNPSRAVLDTVATPSVAEAAALASGGELIVPKRKSRPAGRAPMATCAVARETPRGEPQPRPAEELPRRPYFPPGDEGYHHHHHGSHAHTL